MVMRFNSVVTTCAVFFLGISLVAVLCSFFPETTCRLFITDLGAYTEATCVGECYPPASCNTVSEEYPSEGYTQYYCLCGDEVPNRACEGHANIDDNGELVSVECINHYCPVPCEENEPPSPNTTVPACTCGGI